MTNINPRQLIPYCIYHFNDTNIDFGYIGSPSLVNNYGNILYKCLDNVVGNGFDDRWKLYGTFFAISPMVRPIPRGLKLINANKAGKYPYDTESIRYSYDVFTIESNSVSFLTWTKPIDGTVPLYLYITPRGGSYPSFNKISIKEGWSENIISPIYVLVDPKNYIGSSTNLFKFKRDKNDLIEFKFTPVHDRCIPDPTGVNLNTCFLLTEKTIQLSDEINTVDILQMLTTKKKQNITTFLKNLSPIIIFIIILFFMLSLITCIVILYMA
jgi:hypothetical protein